MIAYYLQRAGVQFRWASLLFFEHELHAATRPVDAPGGDTRRVSPEELREMQCFGGWMDQAGALACLRQHPGWALIGAYNQDKLVGSCWIEVSVGTLSIFDLDLDLPQATFHINHVYVDPAARRSGVAAKLISRAMAEARRMGLARGMLCCVPGNAPMRRVMLNLQWREYLHADYRRALALRLYRLYAVAGGPALTLMSAGSAARELATFGSKSRP